MKLRVSDSSIQSLSLSPLFTDGFCFLFPSPLGSLNMLSLIVFPLLSLYRFHLVYLMHRSLYAPFAFRIHFDLVYPKHEQLGFSLVSTASFCQNRTFSSEQFYFFRFHMDPSKARVSYWKLFCWFYFTQYSMYKIFLVDDSLFSVHQCQRSAPLVICKYEPTFSGSSPVTITGSL